VIEQMTEQIIEARTQLLLGKPVRIEWSPGNGTRYDVLLQPMDRIWQRALRGPDPIRDDVSMVDHGDCVMVSWINAGRCYPIYLFGGTAAPGYLADKFDCNQTDAAALQILLALLAGQLPMATWQDAHALD
jgi:hypothetical protein